MRWLAAALAVIILTLAGCGGGTQSASCKPSAQTKGQQVCSEDALQPPAGEPAISQDRQTVTPSEATQLLQVPQPFTSGSNGNLSSSEISAATGCSVGLANSAAAAWNHVAVIVHEHTGYWLQSNGSMSCYRTYAQQVYLRNYWCNLGNCSNAAVPGTSNHGWGVAVDGPPQTVSYIHQYSGGLFGQGYGSCSDAPWEGWHIKYCGGYSGPDPGPYGSGGGGGGGFHVLKHGSRGPRVQKLQTHLFYLHNAGTRNGYLVRWSYRTGYYGDHTKHAVYKLQHDGNLHQDGVYGQHTAHYQAKRWHAFCNKHPHKADC